MGKVDVAGAAVRQWEEGAIHAEILSFPRRGWLLHFMHAEIWEGACAQMWENRQRCQIWERGGGGGGGGGPTRMNLR